MPGDDKHPNLADPDFEPTDEQLQELSRRAFAGVAEARQAALTTLAQVPTDDRIWCQTDLESLP